MAEDEATDMTQTSSLPAAKPVLALRSGFNTAFRQLLALIGLFMIALSIPIGIMTPLVPVGLPFGILGVILLGRNSVWGHRWMESRKPVGSSRRARMERATRPRRWPR